MTELHENSFENFCFTRTTRSHAVRDVSSSSQKQVQRGYTYRRRFCIVLGKREGSFAGNFLKERKTISVITEK